MAEWLSPDEQRAWRAYLTAHTRLEAVLHRRLQQESDLSHTDYEVLVHLSEAPEGALRGFQLGAALRWEKSRLSHQLKRMEKRGLVRRSECNKDARGAWFGLTAEGRKAIVEAAPKHAGDVRRYVFDVLSADQVASLAEISEAITAAVEPDNPPECAGPPD